MPTMTLKEFVVQNLPQLPLEVIAAKIGQRTLMEADYFDTESRVELDKDNRVVSITKNGLRKKLAKVDELKEVELLNKRIDAENAAVEPVATVVPDPPEPVVSVEPEPVDEINTKDE